MYSLIGLSIGGEMPGKKYSYKKGMKRNKPRRRK